MKWLITFVSFIGITACIIGLATTTGALQQGIALVLIALFVIMVVSVLLQAKKDP